MKAERIELITRRHCPLCDRARAALVAATMGRDLGISELDVDDDEELEHDFTDRVPVIRYRGLVLAEGRVDPAQLQAALAQLANSGRDEPDDSVTAAEIKLDRG